MESPHLGGTAESRIARLVAPRSFDVGTQLLRDPPAGHVLVRILVCGVCASERHAVEEPLPSYPVEIGHEPVGVIEAIGPGVDTFTEERG